MHQTHLICHYCIIIVFLKAYLIIIMTPRLLTWTEKDTERLSLAWVERPLYAALSVRQEGHAAGPQELKDALLQDLVALSQVHCPLQVCVTVVHQQYALRGREMS